MNKKYILLDEVCIGDALLVIVYHDQSVVRKLTRWDLESHRLGRTYVASQNMLPGELIEKNRQGVFKRASGVVLNEKQSKRIQELRAFAKRIDNFLKTNS